MYMYTYCIKMLDHYLFSYRVSPEAPETLDPQERRDLL